MTELQLFHLLAVLLVVSALASVLGVRSVLGAALCLGSTLLSLSGLFVLLAAPMIAIVQLIVGAGGVMLVAAFLMTLLEAGGGEAPLSPRTPGRSAVKAGGVLAMIVLALLLAVVMRPAGMPEAAEPAMVGGPAALGQVLFVDFVVVVEVMGLVLLSALIGAAVLVRQRPVRTTPGPAAAGKAASAMPAAAAVEGESE
jgi:NADH-quinone oxidoreductase subunit J